MSRSGQTEPNDDQTERPNAQTEPLGDLMEQSGSQTCPSDGQAPARIAVFCVGNRLKLDDGIGPAVYDELTATYDFPENVEVFDVGCLSLDMLPYVRDCGLIVTVDAVDGTGEAPGTVFRFLPEDMARRPGAMQSLHDLRLPDLFDTAALLGYEADGICLGMQVENMSPLDLTIGLTPQVHAALPLLAAAVVAELAAAGAEAIRKKPC